MLANIISEIGDISVFETADQLTSWTGLAPSSHSSGGKVKNGRIGRTGNRYLKRILVQVARYRREDKGISVRKILAIIHHLLTNIQPYEELGVNERVRSQKVRERDEFSVSRALRLLARLKM